MRRPSSEITWALLYSLVLVALALFDPRLRSSDDPAVDRRVWAFVALLALAMVAAVVEAASRHGRRQ